MNFGSKILARHAQHLLHAAHITSDYTCVYCAAAGTIFETTDVYELGFFLSFYLCLYSNVPYYVISWNISNIYSFKLKDKCCNNSWGRTARQFVWHTSYHGLKYLVYCRKHLFERLGWAIICLLAAILSLYFAVMATIHFYEEPTRIHFKKVRPDTRVYQNYIDYCFNMHIILQKVFKIISKPTHYKILVPKVSPSAKNPLGFYNIISLHSVFGHILLW